MSSAGFGSGFAWRFACIALCAALSSQLVACQDNSDAGGKIDALDGGTSAALSCDFAVPTTCIEPAPKFSAVQPIFREYCASCHDGTLGGPWPLDSYDHIADWSDEIRGELIGCTMPPADAGVPLPTDQREKLLQWIRCGVPE